MASLAAPAGLETERRARRALPYPAALGLAILAGAALLLLFTLTDIRNLRFGDPDDLMRMQEVRDWLSGQSWFDVTQYRIAPPTGLSMHWSRLLDVPLAAVILLCRPFVGQAQAELAASVIVPLATFATIAALVAAIARRTLGIDKWAVVAALCAVADVGMISVARPMRIDHHGWQAACALAMALALIGDRSWRRAALAGIFAGLWMHISLEGIVFTAGCSVWLGLRWILGQERCASALPAFLGAVATASLGFFLVGHGGALFDRTFCDAISPVHMVVFALAAAGSALAVRFAPGHIVARGLALGGAALVAALTYKLWAPQCGGGAFSALTPLTYRLWYLTVAEGLPLWTQPAMLALGWLAFPLVGVAGTLYAIRTAAPARRGVLIDYGVLLLVSILIGCVLMRASALANLLAIPGALAGFAPLWERIKAIPHALLRVPASALAILFVIPATPAFIALAAIPDRTTAQDRQDGQCASAANMRHFDALPAAVLMTTLDSSQMLIYATRQSAVGSGYHRNVAAMEDVIRFYTADDATAHAIMRKHGARYAFVCPGDGDARKYAEAAPHGLAARLEAGTPPDWLRPVTIAGLRYARVYRLVD
jgi:hypothetical protein